MAIEMVKTLFNREFNIDEKYRPVFSTILCVFALAYPIMFLGLFHFVAFLGPGLGDDWNMAPFYSAIDTVKPHPLLLMVFMTIVIATAIHTSVIMMAGYFLYPKTFNKPYPLTVFFTFFFLNLLAATALGLINVLMGGVTAVFGHGFSAGLNAIPELLIRVYEWGQQVPTLPDAIGIHIPGWLAFILVIQIGGFFHYWFHRLAHESRVLWLLYHRPHHMTPELIQPTTQPVITAFPLMLLVAVPYVLIFSALGKLITTESIVIYIITFRMLILIPNLFSHQTSLYDWAHKQWFLRFMSNLSSEGVYHYLHHSRETEHNNNRGNLVNIGGGVFFIWDRIFGTWRDVSDHRPAVGLMDIPPEQLTTNPLRLVFAGISQLVYELIKNHDWKTRWQILMGTTDYLPPHSRDFARKG